MKKAIFATLSSYLIWGFLPLYWKLLGHFAPLYILADRIVFCCVFMFFVLYMTKRLHLIKEVFSSRKKLLCTIGSAVFITINWGLYIWAVSSGMVIDSSLGYYINPLIIFAFSVILFKEKSSAWEFVAIGLAAAGVFVMTFYYGKFPYLALTLAVSFALYGVFKKMADLDAAVSLTIETAIVTPFALGYFLFTSFGQRGALLSASSFELVVLLLAGAVTALPLLLYSIGVKGLPFSLVGFFQYISPTIMLLLGVFAFGEHFSVSSLVSFGFIWVGLAIFTISKVKQNRVAAAQRAANTMEVQVQTAE